MNDDENNATIARFLEQVAKHQMTVKLDNGVHRHLRFQDPETCNRWFELVTWPGHLCIAGDMGTYVFWRLDDMFEFFRRDTVEINTGYWHEKLQADSRFEGAKQFSRSRFEEAVRDDFDRLTEFMDADRKAGLWQEVKDSVLSCEDTAPEAYRAATEFECDGFHFQDFWENDLMEYTPHFKWCLRAIVWGIQQYDAFKAGEDRRFLGVFATDKGDIEISRAATNEQLLDVIEWLSNAHKQMQSAS